MIFASVVVAAIPEVAVHRAVAIAATAGIGRVAYRVIGKVAGGWAIDFVVDAACIVGKKEAVG